MVEYVFVGNFFDKVYGLVQMCDGVGFEFGQGYVGSQVQDVVCGQVVGFGLVW